MYFSHPLRYNNALHVPSFLGYAEKSKTVDGDAPKLASNTRTHP